VANIKAKKITELETWDEKELRKLKITVNNRLSALSVSEKPLAKSHPLFGKDAGYCKDLLVKIIQAEKKLKTQL